MVEPINILFGLRTRVGPRNHVLDWGPDPRGKGQCLAMRGKGRPTVKYRDTLRWIVQKWLNRSRCRLDCGLGWAQGIMYYMGPDPTCEATIIRGKDIPEHARRHCRELCKNGWTDRFAVRVVDLGASKEAQVQSYSPGCVNVTHWRNLANTIQPSVCGGDAAFCQITLTTCLILSSYLQPRPDTMDIDAKYVKRRGLRVFSGSKKTNVTFRPYFLPKTATLRPDFDGT